MTYKYVCASAYYINHVRKIFRGNTRRLGTAQRSNVWDVRGDQFWPPTRQFPAYLSKQKRYFSHVEFNLEVDLYFSFRTCSVVTMKRKCIPISSTEIV